MRTVDPGKKPDTQTSPLFQKYVSDYLTQVQRKIDQGESADEAFKAKPSVSRMKPDELINIFWENQHLGTWDIPKNSVNLFYAMEGILQKAIYIAAVQWWGKQKTERKRQTNPSDTTVVKDKTQDDVATKVETKKAASTQEREMIYRIAGHRYRKASFPRIPFGKPIPPAMWERAINILTDYIHAGEAWVAAGRPQEGVLSDRFEAADSIYQEMADAIFGAKRTPEQSQEWEVVSKHESAKARAQLGLE